MGFKSDLFKSRNLHKCDTRTAYRGPQNDRQRRKSCAGFHCICGIYEMSSVDGPTCCIWCCKRYPLRRAPCRSCVWSIESTDRTIRVLRFFFLHSIFFFFSFSSRQLWFLCQVDLCTALVIFLIPSRFTGKFAVRSPKPLLNPDFFFFF